MQLDLERQPISNLPTWAGADTVYARCQLINSELCRRSYAAAKKRRDWRPPDDVREAIDAMNRGDEESLKSWTFRHRDIWAPVAKESSHA